MLRGIPHELRPADGAPEAPYEIVTDGPRNLARRPFDYRNPFPLRPTDEVKAPIANGPETAIPRWPIPEGDGPFDYYANGNAALGLPGGPECALVDPAGTLRVFTGGWAIGAGADARPFDLRVRLLEEGPIPIVRASDSREDGRLRVEYLAAEIAGAPECAYPVANNGSYRWVGGAEPRGRNLFLFWQGELTGPPGGGCPALHLGYRQSAALCAGAFYTRPAYAPGWSSPVLSPLGDGRFRLLATHAGDEYVLGVLHVADPAVVCDEARIAHWPAPLPLSPARPAELGVRLAPAGARQARLRFEWVIPHFPLRSRDGEVLLTATHRGGRQCARRIWRRRRRAGAQVRIPEAKVQDAFVQALNHLDLCSVRLGQSEFPTPGPSGGHHIFYERDNIDLIHAYDLVGDHARAARMIGHYLLCDVQQETSGMVLWLLGEHLRITSDRRWARRLFPDAARRMSWLIHTWLNSRDANDGLLPATSIPDNELIAGHFVSYHLYAMAGARAGVAMAEAAGEGGLAAEWKAFSDEFSRAVLRRMEQLVARTGGVLTPGFEGYDTPAVTVNVTWVEKPYSYTPIGAYGPTGGNDWHNLGAAFPTENLPPDHAWITSSLARWRHAYVEGIFPYPTAKGEYAQLHNYNTMNLSGTWLRRGDHAEALRDLYGVLLHTTATHGSAEGVDSAGRRDFNCTPHNWFSAKLVRFVRDLLVYEGAGRRLHLLAGLAPAWMKPGQEVAIERAPTAWGLLSLRATMREGGMQVALDLRPRGAAPDLMLHLPPFVREPRVFTAGRPVATEDGGWPLPAGAREVSVEWAPSTVLPDISFDRIVDAYRADYRRRCAASC